MVLIFNEGDCPEYDQCDTAFLGRLLFVPMRSKFVAAPVVVDDEEWTFEMDPDIQKRFKAWLPALMDVLVDHYGAEGTFDRPPLSMVDWKSDVTTNANPAAKWCEDNLEVTGCRSDFVLLGPLGQQTGISNFVNLAKAYYSGVSGVTYKDRTNAKIDGVHKVRHNVIKGVRVRALE